jgi:hypothetical protein
MTSITQKIPRYILGMSDQPDELKVPGQVRDATNVLPDVTLGLLKRPGCKHIAELTETATGEWFHIHKNNPFTGSEKYLGQIQRDGVVKIWDLNTGKAQTVTYSDEALDPDNLGRFATGYSASQFTTRDTKTSEDYFLHNKDNQLQVLTVNDYTFVTNRETMPSMSEEVVSTRPYEAFVEIRAVSQNQPYLLGFSTINSDDDDKVVEFTTATGLTVSFDGWDGYLHTDQEDICARSGTNVETNQSFGSGSGMSWYSQVSCTSIPARDPIPGAPNVASQYSVTVTLTNGGTGFQVGDTVVKGYGFPGNNYRFRVSSVGKSTIRASLGTATYTASSQDANAIITNLVTEINEIAGLTAEAIGNGIYITSTEPFTVETPDPTLMSIVSATDDGTFTTVEEGATVEKTNVISGVNNVAQLPYQCKHGYIVKVRNSFELEDDYYLKFQGNFEQDGDGTWEECAKPGIQNLLNPQTMPHAILRLSTVTYDDDGDPIVTFWVGPMQWAPREAGDEITNPRPSFAPRPGAAFGRPIQNILFFRDRLVFLSDEYITMSRTGEYFKLFAKSALTVAADDPIDVAVSSTVPALLHDGIVIGPGLLVVSPNQQFLLRTENDLLSPLTVKVTNIASYNLNENTKPISLGTTVGFFSDTGKYSRFYEMADITINGDPEVVEQSKSAGTLLPADLEIIADSQENDLVFASEPGSNEVWCYKYFNTGEKRVLSSWFKWEMIGTVLYHAVIFDSYYAVLLKDSKVQLVRLDIRPLYDATTITEEDFRIHLDYYKGVDNADMTYTSASKETTFTLTIPDYTADHPLVVYSLGDNPGRIATGTVSGTTVTLKGDWTDADLVMGYNFTMSIKFPKLYVTSKDRLSNTITSDTRGSLIIQRVKLDLGDSGHYQATLKSLGREDRVITYETAIEDTYNADDVAILPSIVRTIPVYDRNTNVRIELESTHPSPTTLYSLEWEGDYTPMYYQFV